MGADLGRPYVWEKSYPRGISWDTPIETMTLPAMLDRSVARNASRHAISFRERRLTYRDLADAADAFAAGLLAAGIGKGDGIGCYLPNSPHHVIALFGATRAGARLVQAQPARCRARRSFTSWRIPARASCSPRMLRRCCRWR